MAQEHTFDVVSRVNLQEVRNALQQVQKEIVTRFDFKGTDTTIENEDSKIEVHSSTEDRLKAAVEVLKDKMVKRGVSLKALSVGQISDAAKGTSKVTTDARSQCRSTLPGIPSHRMGSRFSPAGAT